MAGKSYRRIAAIGITNMILKHLADQREPVSAADVIKALDLPSGTVMCHLATLEDLTWVRRIGECWELGYGIALLWARKKAQIEDGINRMRNDLRQLGVDSDA